MEYVMKEKIKYFMITIYHKILYCLGVDILYPKIILEYTDKQDVINMHINNIFNDTPDKMLYHISEAKKVRWMIFKLNKTHNIEKYKRKLDKYCMKYDVDADDFVNAFNNEYEQIFSNNIIRDMILGFYKIMDIYVTELFLFDLYFTTRLFKNKIYQLTDIILLPGMDYMTTRVADIVRDDKTGYLEYLYYKYLSKQLKNKKMLFDEKYKL